MARKGVGQVETSSSFMALIERFLDLLCCRVGCRVVEAETHGRRLADVIVLMQPADKWSIIGAMLNGVTVDIESAAVHTVYKMASCP